MVFSNENEGYLFGEKYGEIIWGEDRDAVRVDTAMVYRTLDGGLTWQGENLNVVVITNAHRSRQVIQV